MSSDVDPKQYDLDPNGDVILLMGNEKQIQLKVSSKVLSLASQVFASMFGPFFAEGHELNTDGKVELPLPDDDPTVMIWICKKLHFIPDSSPLFVQSNPFLLNFCIICDKYGLHAAFSDAIVPTLENLEKQIDKHKSNKKDDILLCVMFMSFIFRLPQFYSNSTRYLYGESTGSIASFGEEFNGSIHPELINEYCTITAERSAAKERIQKLIDESFLGVLTVSAKCEKSIREIGEHYTELIRIGLLPLTSKLAGLTIKEVLTRGKTYKPHESPSKSQQSSPAKTQQPPWGALKCLESEELMLLSYGRCVSCVWKGKGENCEGWHCKTTEESEGERKHKSGEVVPKESYDESENNVQGKIDDGY